MASLLITLALFVPGAALSAGGYLFY